MSVVKEHKLAAVSEVRCRLDRVVPRETIELRPRFWDSAPTILSDAEAAVPRKRPADLPTWPVVDPRPLLECAIRTDFRHAMGALLGLAIGDALGTTLEFTSIDGLSFRELVRGPHREIIGQGPFGLEPGQVTDDTQMAICLFDSIADNHRIDANDLLVRYRAWKQVAFDIGYQTRASLAAAEPDGGRVVWEDTGRQAIELRGTRVTAGELLDVARSEVAPGVLQGGVSAISDNGDAGNLDVTNMMVFGTTGTALDIANTTGAIRFSTIVGAPTNIPGLKCNLNFVVQSSIIWDLQSTAAPVTGACPISTSTVGPVAIAGSMNVDPKFVDAANNNFHIAAGSPAIDFVSAGPTVDFEGDPRPQGPRFDIGADEAKQ